MECAFVSQTGYYPKKPDHENQDCYALYSALNGDPNTHMLSIFDGHGPNGTEVAEFAKNSIRELMERQGKITPNNAEALLGAAMTELSERLKRSQIDDEFSGTTAVSVLVHHRTLYIANVGDSRGVVASFDGKELKACDLSSDHNCYRQDERDRVQAKGKAIVGSAAQVYGNRPQDDAAWEDDWDGSDPPRVWHKWPENPSKWIGGTAFTRSIGDRAAHEHGAVISEAEYQQRSVTEQDRVLLIASDGVFEYLDSQACVDIIVQYTSPMDGCRALVDQSFKHWLDNETRTDDISAIVVRLDGLNSLKTIL